MANFTKISYEKDELNTELSKIFSKLIETGVVNGILSPTLNSTGVIKQTLIVDPAKTGNVDPFSPVIPVNSAKIASSLTAKPSDKKIGILLRSCESRALVELVKLNQANLDNVLLFGLDCFGRYENNDFYQLREKELTAESFIKSAQSENTENNGFDITDACKMCEHPSADNVDIRLCVIGLESGSFGLESVSEKGQKALEDIGLSGSDQSGKREDSVHAVTKKRNDEFQAKLEEYKENINSINAFEDNVAKCINCYNCRVACPVCYCKECVFVTDTFRHDGEQFVGWAQKDGILKMPTDTAFYHLTRMTHNGHFCVGCGQCESACPNDIKLTMAFKASAKASQDRFEYEAGRSLEEEQPLTVFHDDELVEVTGQVK